MIQGMTYTEIHKEIEDRDLIEQYVLNKLSTEERRVFQEHFFECDKCFEQAELAARFIAGVRDAVGSGVLAADQTDRLPSRSRLFPVLNQRWTSAWLMPALAASLLLAVTLSALWALSLSRENRQLADLRAEQNRAADQMQQLDAKVRELEASGNASQELSEALKEENVRLKEQLAKTERQLGTQLAELRQPDINVPVQNIYPADSQRSTGPGEINRLRVPQGTRAFVLILGDYKPGYSDYRLEILDASGRQVTRREGLKPNQAGELSVMVTRTLMKRGNYRLKLYGGREAIAEYVVRVE